MKRNHEHSERNFKYNFDAAQRQEEESNVQNTSLYQQFCIEALHQQIAELKIKARAYDVFLGTDGSASMEVVAKTLGIGRNSLFRYLREHRVLTQRGTPYAKYNNRGYFHVRLKPVWIPDRGHQTVPVVLVTPRGMDFIYRKLSPSGRIIGHGYTDPAFEWYLRSLDEADEYGYDLMEVAANE